MSTSHKLARNNPHLPFWCPIPGRGYYHLIYPHTLRAAKLYLKSLSQSIVMVRQCSECHRFITGAPNPDVDHNAPAPGRGACTLSHHPPPCPFVSEHGVPCTHSYTSEDLIIPSAIAGHINPSFDSSDGDLTLVQQLEQLRREKAEETRPANTLQLANSNLRDSQVSG